MLKSLFSAFLMYSKIPVPQVEWKEENRRYALCFFPFVGAVISILYVLWNAAAIRFGIGSILTGAVSMLISFGVTGGIHLDGFCDVSDAVASYGDTEKRLAIMKDSHVGAFAVIHLAVCLILQTAVYSEVHSIRLAAVVALGFVLSRTCSAAAAVTWRCARKDGSLQSFVKPSHKAFTILWLMLLFFATVAAMLVCDIRTGSISALSGLLIFGYYRISAYQRFGGITGDTEGWFLVLCETVMGLSAVLSERICT